MHTFRAPDTRTASHVPTSVVGTATQGTALTPADNEGVHAVSVESATRVDYHVIARESTEHAITSFFRIDAHGTHGTTCKFWGMVTPSR